MKKKSGGEGIKGLIGPAVFIVVCVMLYKAGAFDWAKDRWDSFNPPANLGDYASKMSARISDEPRCAQYRYRILDLGSASGDPAMRAEKIRTYYEAAGRDHCSRNTYSPGG